MRFPSPPALPALVGSEDYVETKKVERCPGHAGLSKVYGFECKYGLGKRGRWAGRDEEEWGLAMKSMFSCDFGYDIAHEKA